MQLATLVKRHYDIVDVISRDIKLQKSGKYFIGKCKFHDDHNPSFFVDPDKQTFSCKVCKDVWGDVIKYRALSTGLSNGAAMSALAKEANLSSEDDFAPSEVEKRRYFLKKSVGFANTLYMDALNKCGEGSPILNYLSERQITRNDVDVFGLGFAPSNGSFLTNKVKDAFKQNFFDLGLISTNDNGEYDFFRNRLIFPISDLKGDVVGFGARSLTDDKKYKYINSSESDVFSKHEHLFGIFQALDSIRETQTVYVVEGYLDVIAMHKYGYRNTVAALGTAISAAQISLLYSLCKNIVFVMDGDKAGNDAMNAVLKIIAPKVFSSTIYDCGFVTLPPEQDPDSLLSSEHGRTAFSQLLATECFSICDRLLAFTHNNIVSCSYDGFIIKHSKEIVSLIGPDILKEWRIMITHHFSAYNKLPLTISKELLNYD